MCIEIWEARSLRLTALSAMTAVAFLAFLFALGSAAVEGMVLFSGILITLYVIGMLRPRKMNAILYYLLATSALFLALSVIERVVLGKTL